MDFQNSLHSILLKTRDPSLAQSVPPLELGFSRNSESQETTCRERVLGAERLRAGKARQKCLPARSWTAHTHRISRRKTRQDAVLSAVLSAQQYNQSSPIPGVFIHLPLPPILKMEMISSNFNSLNYLGKQFQTEHQRAACQYLYLQSFISPVKSLWATLPCSSQHATEG